MLPRQLSVRFALIFTFLALPLSAEEHFVDTPAALVSAVENAAPGDVVVMAAGEWKDLQVTLHFNGEEDSPITLRAAEPGRTRITGQTQLRVEGQHGVISGLVWDRATVPEDGSYLVSVGARDDGTTGITITQSRFLACNPDHFKTRYAWIQLHGRRQQVSHSEFAGQNHSGVTIQIRVGAESPEHHIHNNLFRDRAPGDGNGFEMIQIGQSGDSRKRGGTIVENNWFVRCDGETEIVSSKGPENIIRGNLFLDSSGTLTLRHGVDNIAEGNFFIGRVKEASGGIRIVDSGHVVRHNYFTGLTGRTGGVVALYNGIPDSPLNGYFPASDVTIDSNAFIDNAGNLIFLNAGFGSRNRVLAPENITINNNLWLGTMDGAVAIAGTNPNIRLQDNKYGPGLELGIHAGSGATPLEEELTEDIWGFSSNKFGPTKPWPSRTDVGPSWSLPLPSLVLLNEIQVVNLARADAGEAAVLRQSLLESAHRILDQQKLYSVTDNERLPPSGDSRDYYSTGPYWWPNPDTANGLPYIRIDGKFNPERDRVSDRDPLLSMIGDVKTIAMAYAVTGKEQFAQYGHRLLHHWFLDPKAGMNPNLRHAQAIPGRTDGRGTGIIDAHPFAELIDAILILQESPGFPHQDIQALQQWFAEYLRWLLHSPNGRDEADSANNHGTAYDLQAAAIMAFLGREDQLRNLFITSVLPRIDHQIQPGGAQPEELRRTRTWSYSTENLEHFFKLGLIGRTVGIDLFAYETKDGATLHKALDYLLPSVCDPSAWPHEQQTKWQHHFILSVISIAQRTWPQEDFSQYIDCLHAAPNQLEGFLLRGPTNP